ncbi:MAG: nicotinate-nucleotide adenylyltransferase [Thermoleophilia bacterium]|nr:nicotinate-nucleotide adenylyltransferase [Thermoleophilia bacterium]
MTARGPAIGVLGGSFDPPHLGHLLLAAEAWWQLGLDEVRLVPAARPPHKPDGPTMDAAVRARMVERACREHPALTCWRVEIDREGPSYTADTLDRLHEEAPGVRAWFLLGTDQLAGLPGWRDPERILARARLGVALRDGEDPDAARALAERVAPGRVDWVRMPAVGISSTLVRARLAAGEPVRFLVPPGVEEILRQAGHCRDALGAGPPT